MTSWAYLNDEGKKEWGDVFPDGKVPVKSFIPVTAYLEKRGEKAIYIVDMKALDNETLDKIIDKIAEKFKAPREDILKSIIQVGLPIRAELTQGSATDDLKYL